MGPQSYEKLMFVLDTPHQAFGRVKVVPDIYAEGQWEQFITVNWDNDVAPASILKAIFQAPENPDSHNVAFINADIADVSQQELNAMLSPKPWLKILGVVPGSITLQDINVHSK